MSHRAHQSSPRPLRTLAARQRIPACLVAMLALAGAAAVGTGPASAASAGGDIGTAALQCNPTDLNGGYSLPNGRVCIDYDPQGYRAAYVNSGSPAGNWMDFNLHCDNHPPFGTNGAFLADRPEHTYSYVFKVGSKGRCKVVLYDRSAGGEDSSPYVTR